MCEDIQCKNCVERYECECYQAYLGFGKFNVEVNPRVKRTTTEDKTLDYYDEKEL